MGLEHDVAIRESVPESVLPVFYSAADVTSVFSIGYDPLPTVMIESMACGTPVVATEMPTRAQVITNGENGLMVPENDEGAWVAAVERLIADARFAERIREAALARVRERFDMDRVAAQYLELYRSL
jgi:glycosyltransferase involved in cell wall biosynthesis